MLDKPTGVTSHDVVDAVRRRLRAGGAGHLGTLDPGASGLLVVAMGAATRCAAVWQGGEKTYEATVRFGVTTATQDLQGEVIARREASLEEAQVREAARAFVGALDQVPPMVSALKVGGRRLYELARRGQVVERAPRRIEVRAWEWLAFDLPEATFRVRCSGGTYVRTLAHDLGERLGTGGALKSLRRLRSEPFGLERAIPLRELDAVPAEEVLARAGVPLDTALEVLPPVALDAGAAAELGFGRPALVEPGGAPLGAGPRSVVLRDAAGRALALGELVPAPVPGGPAPGGARVLACPHVVFPWAVRRERP
ncbi:MAG: tRNA pseudouridine(55) synthase TruB [Candidatus Eisenbacteria bacterium]|nr:tRNA pseudouridine(55) synthase TruB [Candidatus Eisenbacteria bacterium]